MIIEELDIKNFGKLNRRNITLHPGMNVVYGENESGKSTLHTFIRSMFFGVSRMRGKAARTDVYNRCEPWENPALYGGSMDFECGGKAFRLTRNFYKDTQNARLISLEDGEHLSIEHGDLQMLLGGINESIYDNTVSVGQLKSVTQRELADELQSYIANYQGSGDEDINPAEAVQILREQRKELLQQKREQVSGQEISKREVQAKIELVQKQMQECKEKIREAEQERCRAEDEAQRCQPYENKGTQIGNQEKEQSVKREKSQSQLRFDRIWNGIAIGWAAVALLAMILAVIFKGGDTSIVFVVLAAAAGIQLPISLVIRAALARKLAVQRSNELENRERTVAEPQVDDLERTVDKSAEVREKLGKTRWKLQQLHEELQEHSLLKENLQQEADELEGAFYEKGSLDEELEGIQLAIDTLEKTVSRMQRGIGSRLRTRTGEILGELTEGRYTNILLGDDMHIQVQTLERELELHQLSRGTLEQVYFAFRMAVSEVLCCQESMPVVLDDVFAMYDETRLAQVLKWLDGHKEQVVIFTCHKREGEVLERLGIPCNRVFL